jgi:hypothetical protein
VRIGDAVQAAEQAVAELRSLADSNPDLSLERNPVGNYSIVRHLPGYVEDWGYVDVFNEGVVLDGDPE